jgi:DNA transposition AAA+ family ATPase
MTETLTPSAARETAPPVTVSEAAEASSAHSRVNVPINLANWKDLPEDVQALLMWFHQHVLDEGLNFTEAGQALGYDKSTVFRVLKGTYEGSWKKIAEAISSYRKVQDNRGTIQKNEFAENSMTRMIFAGLDYALANNSITLVVGESRMGKTTAAKVWRDRNNHGRSVYVTAPAYGGTKALLSDIAGAIGINRNIAALTMHQRILSGFNKHRILIIDEAHRLLPSDRRTNPTNLELIRDIHDRTGCAVALLATQRFDTELRKQDYMFEQLLGRIGMPIRLPRRIKVEDIRPIVQQYASRPTQALMDACDKVANDMGRLGILVETLKVASRIAAKAQAKLAEEHIFKAMKLRREMQGETLYAAK